MVRSDRLSFFSKLTVLWFFLPSALLMLGGVTFFEAQAEELGGIARESGSGRSHRWWWDFSDETRAAHPVWTAVLGPISEWSPLSWLALGVACVVVMESLRWLVQRAHLAIVSRG